MGTSGRWTWLDTLIVLFLAALVVASLWLTYAHAEVPTFTQGEIKTVTCTPPTSREDGTPLLISEIDHMEVYITQDAANKGEAQIAGLDCRLEVDTSSMVGTWYVIGVTVDTGGLKSVDSEAVPFTVVLTLSRPRPPTMRID